jgi:hypothetical protein
MTVITNGIEYFHDGETATVRLGSSGTKVRILHSIPVDSRRIPVNSIGPDSYSRLSVSVIQIPSSIEVICKGAFAFSQIDQIQFCGRPSVTHFESEAFVGATLKKIVIPKSVELIDPYCFSQCRSLSEVLFESGSRLRKIGRNAFARIGIKVISIPSDVEVLGIGCFSQCKCLETVNFAGNSRLSRIDGRAFFMTGIVSIAIPASVQMIGSMCFSRCPALSSITFSENAALAMIGESAFEESGLRTIQLPASLRSVDGGALRGLADVTVAAGNLAFFLLDYVLLDATRRRAIRGVGRRRALMIPWNVVTLGNSCFAGQTELTTVEFSKSPRCVLEIIEDRAFEGSSIRDIELPASVKFVGPFAFANCRALTGVRFEDGSQLLRFTEGAFSQSALKLFWTPSMVEVIDRECFQHCTQLSAVVFGERVRIIEEAAFMNTGLETITVPASVEEIEAKAFAKCKALVGVEMLPQSKLRVIGQEAFANTGLKRIDIPSSLLIIRRSAFEGCSSLKYVAFPENCVLETIGERAFSGSGVPELALPKSVSDIGKSCFAQLSQIEKFIFQRGSSLRVLSESAFSKGKLISIEIPAEIEIIGACCFRDCSRLSTVTFEDGSQLKRIGPRAFAASALTQIALPKSVGAIGESCFENCCSFVQMPIEADSQLKRLGANAFTGSSLASLFLPKTIEQIGSQFSDELTLVTIDAENPKFVVENRFVYTRDRTRIVATIGPAIQLDVGETFTSIGSRACAGLRSLVSMRFSGTSQLRVVEEYAFYQSTLTGVELPPTVEILGKCCFAHCERFSILTIPRDSSLRRIEAKAFSFTLLQSVAIPRQIDFIDGSALHTLLGVATSLGGRVYSYDGTYLFEGDTLTIVRSFNSAPAIELPSLFLALGDCSFYRCQTIRTLTWAPDCDVRIFGRACLAKSTIEEIIVPRSVAALGERCFYGCFSLSDITFEQPSCLGRIDAEAFARSGLKTIAIPGNVTLLDGSAVQCIDSVIIGPDNRTLITQDRYIFTADRATIVAQLGLIDVVTVPPRAHVIGPGCFEGRVALLRVEFHPSSSLRVIGDRAFARSGLSDISIPNTVEDIGNSAFMNCAWLKSVTFSSDGRLYRIGAFAFWETAVSEIALPKSIIHLKSHCFPAECNVIVPNIDAFKQWRAAYLSDLDSVMTRDASSDFGNIADVFFQAKDYLTKREIGRGTGGRVLECVHRQTGEVLAVKRLSNFYPNDDRERLQFLREVEILRRLDHPCLVPLKGVAIQGGDEPPLIAMEYLGGGTLADAIRDRPEWFTPTAKAIITTGIVLGMIHVHSQRILHRDLKPCNILLDADRRPHIGDFGISEFQDFLRRSDGSGTPSYMAPECFEPDAAITGKVDVYAFSLILYEILTGCAPFQGSVGNIVKHIRAITRGVRPELRSDMAEPVRALLNDTWATSPDDRPSFAAVFERLTMMRFEILEGVQVDEVYQFMEWVMWESGTKA